MDQPATLFELARTLTPRILLFDFGRYLIAAGLISALVWVLRRTSLASRKIQRREATRADFRREFLASLRTVIVYTIVIIPMIWAFQHGVLKFYSGPVSAVGFAGYLAAILLAHDTWFYWTHRAMHTPKLFKTLHKFHHLTATPTPWTAYSFDIGEAFVMVLFMPLYALIVPTPGPVIFTFLAVMILRNAMGHAGLELHPRGWASHPVLKWISTTTHHDLHHNGSYNHNFGFYFTWWDKLMGTEHPRYVEVFDRVTTAGGITAPAVPAAATAPLAHTS